MRDLTGLTAESDTTVAASPPRVWELVSDIALPTRFSDEVRAVRWADGAAGPAKGARFVAENHHPAIGAWRSVCEVVTCDPLREFAWAVLRYEGAAFAGESPAVEEPITVWHFRITPAEGAVR
ncbi:MAG TPA: SRPBCC family protein, partial [Pilimelia sp.]|nr:SRPBCC family protein [Pilimelia sp.]